MILVEDQQHSAQQQQCQGGEGPAGRPRPQPCGCSPQWLGSSRAAPPRHGAEACHRLEAALPAGWIAHPSLTAATPPKRPTCRSPLSWSGIHLEPRLRCSDMAQPQRGDSTPVTSWVSRASKPPQQAPLQRRQRPLQQLGPAALAVAPAWPRPLQRLRMDNGARADQRRRCSDPPAA